MSSCRTAVNSDDRIRNRARPARTRTGARLGLLSAALLVAISLAAESADDLKPPTGYRKWFHVNAMLVDKTSPLFDTLGGMHNVYVNATGEAALKQGGPYPDGTVLLDDVHDFTVSEGSSAEGPLKILGFMAKDKSKYAATGGWGFQAWDGGDPNKPLVTDAAKQCFACHQARKDNDYVYSTYIR